MNTIFGIAGINLEQINIKWSGNANNATVEQMFNEKQFSKHSHRCKFQFNAWKEILGVYKSKTIEVDANHFMET